MKELFLYELNLVYDSVEHDINCMFWSDKIVLEAANKVKGAYAALVSDVYSATRARLSNDANIVCMGAFTTGAKVREMLVDAFFTNEFVAGCSSQPKVNAFREYDQNR